MLKPHYLSSGISITALLLCRSQDLERAHEGRVDGHHSSSIVEFVTVVWSGEQGDKATLSKELITVLDDLNVHRTVTFVRDVRKKYVHVDTQ